MSEHSYRPLFLAVLVCTFLILLSVGVVLLTQTSASSLSQAEDGMKLDELIRQQKFNEALELVEKQRDEAKARGDEEAWTRALIRETQLRIGLHGYENAVRTLSEQPLAEGLRYRTIRQLYYADALRSYFQAYRWEIVRREPVAGSGPLDLKSWTRDQIFAEARDAFEEVWSHRADLGKEPVKGFSEFLEPNDYPAGIRDTVRDAVSYLYVKLLADSSFWTPEQENEVYRLNLDRLMAAAQPQAPSGSAPGHPVERIATILSDLEAWRLSEGRREGALEARLARLQALHTAFTQPEDREKIRARLRNDLPAYRDLPWWATAMAVLAEMVREEPEPGKLVRAREIAEQGYEVYPNDIGGKRCLFLVQSIEEPAVEIESMESDGPQKRSIRVTHKNLTTVYFRAYAADLLSRVGKSRNTELLLSGPEQQALLRRARPVTQWRSQLAPTPDFEMHQTFVVPPLRTPGYYVILASEQEDFREKDNWVSGLNFIVTDLVLLERDSYSSREIEVQVLSGETGRPVAGASVEMYRMDWQTGHRRVATIVTRADGLAQFSKPEDGYGFLLATLGSHLALADSQYFNRRYEEPDNPRSLVYTDRSIYRPNQKILWKLLAFSGRSRNADFRSLVKKEVNVTLQDGNGEEVATTVVKTNEYGTAAGEFLIPSGRLLGSWAIRTTIDGSVSSQPVQVEEYKRPTFEVSLKDPERALRLNQPAVLNGEARYYFGLPVTSGTVKWRVTREPVYPWWWEWYGGSPGKSQTVAIGTTGLGEDGSFEIRFTPEADEREAKKSDQISYRYGVNADVVDEGGETRSATRSFRLGFLSVEAQLAFEQNFYLENKPITVAVVRTDLNGAPRAGKGSWRVVAVKQPDKTLLPAEQPIGLRSGQQPTGEDHRTPGDRLRPRWDPQYSPASVMRSWADGREAARGFTSHDATGRAAVELKGLDTGVYRLRYETTDDFGKHFETSQEFVVAAPTVRVALPALLIVQTGSCQVGETARFVAVSGLTGQTMFFEVYRSGKLSERRELQSGKDRNLIEIPIRDADRGGFAVRLVVLRDHQVMSLDSQVFVPWDNKQLKLEFARFRDKLRPGQQETWQIQVKGPAGTEMTGKAAEILAYMYDRTLDAFAPHYPASVMGLWPYRAEAVNLTSTLGQARANVVVSDRRSVALLAFPHEDELKGLNGYGIGGPGGRGGNYALRTRMSGVAGGVPGGVVADRAEMSAVIPGTPTPPEERAPAKAKEEQGQPAAGTSPALRSDFSETAFWQPQLLTGPDGTATIEFKVPDSVTSWNVWVHAVTKDLLSASLHQEARSVKDLMTRPYVPRFLREGDLAELKVVVNNAGETEFHGNVTIDIVDPATEESLLDAFGLGRAAATQPFAVKPGGGANVTFSLKTPPRVGTVAVRVVATAGDLSDGELRPIPILPGRMHLSQSRFVTLKDADHREMVFADLKKTDDPTRINEQMVVTVDAQLFYSVLSALPYLVNYPYECTEQTLNRFVSSGILSSLYKDYPAVAKMAAEMSKRETRLETWDSVDPNRKMALEETPWLQEARGGSEKEDDLLNVLDPRIAEAERKSALAKLQKSQTAIGGFPWFPGGPPSPYMTLYIMYGFAKAAEFGVEVPRDVVMKGWVYLAQEFREEYASRMIKDDCCWEFLTFLNYVASCYPDPSWMGEALTAAERKQILDHCFKHWKEHSPYLKCQLALTLKRMGRPKDAELVFASVMDSARTTQDEGTFWAPEDRAWLWYNDTIETHAFALRTLTELLPSDTRKDGLVHWLFLNKKLNHWKSTRATAEVIYSLIHYLKSQGQLGIREEATVSIGSRQTRLVFEPDEYTGKKNQIVLPGPEVRPESATVVVEKPTRGLMFASATWHFSTEKLPEEARGDLLSVSRKYFKREKTASGFVLKPLAQGESLEPGDEVEVQLSVSAKHPCEYIHLRDPRAAGLEPGVVVSRYKWETGIAWYEEIRDSGTNFFFEWLPQGEYTLRYRVRANMAGTFRVSPATLQSMYAPEFTAYSTGAVVKVQGKELSTNHTVQQRREEAGQL